MAPSSSLLLQRLRAEQFNVETEKKMQEHPYFAAAEAGTLTRVQLQAFLGEQYHIQLSDATSFAALAGHVGFAPKSLTDVKLPTALQNEDDLFHFLLGGELCAAPLLLEQAKAFGMECEKALKEYPPTSLAQGYPSFWARLALAGKRTQGAAAVAVNFPAWGAGCARVHKALQRGLYGEFSKEQIGFFGFFADPIPKLDEMVMKVIDEERGTDINDEEFYSEVSLAVRLLQEYEVAFWDACYAAK